MGEFILGRFEKAFAKIGPFLQKLKFTFLREKGGVLPPLKIIFIFNSPHGGKTQGPLFKKNRHFTTTESATNKILIKCISFNIKNIIIKYKILKI